MRKAMNSPSDIFAGYHREVRPAAAAEAGETSLDRNVAWRIGQDEIRLLSPYEELCRACKLQKWRP